MRKLNTALVLTVRLLLMAVVSAQAAPQPLVTGTANLSEAEVLTQTDAPALPSSFYGTVALDGADVAEDTVVSAWIDGVRVAEARTTTADVFFVNRSVYILDVPADDPEAPALDGGCEGVVVIFKVEGYPAGQIALWHAGAVVELDLAASAADGVDLAVVKEDGRDTALAGEVLTYTVAVANVGSLDVTGVVLGDTLPAHTAFVAASDGGSEGGDVVAWPAFDLAAGAVAVRTVSVRVDEPLPVDVVEIANTAAVTDDGAHGPDLNPANNAAADVDAVPEIACAFDPAEIAPEGDVGLQAALENLRAQLDGWDDLVDLGGRDRVAAAIGAAAGQLEDYLAETIVAQLEAVATQMSGHVDPDDLAADRRALGAVLCGEVKPALVVLKHYNPSLTVWPTVLATVPGRTVTATLTVANRGDAPATAQLALSGAPSGWTVGTPPPLALEPGVAQQISLPITSDALGTEVFSVTLRLAEAPELTVTRQVAVRVVAELLTITEVRLEPDFMNVGTGTTDVSIRLANPSGLRTQAVARVALTDGGGAVRKTLSTPIVVATNPSSAYGLGALDIDGLEQGIYTATVRVLDLDGALIPNAIGYTHLSVGQALKVGYAVSPALVAPGKAGVTVTTVVTTERTDATALTSTVSFSPTVKWAHTPSGDYNQVLAMPAVGDINLDGIPDIVFPSHRGGSYYYDGLLRVISGDDGSELFSITDHRVGPGSSPAIVDLDNDGLPEIVMPRSGGGLYAFDNTGNLKYSSVPTYTLDTIFQTPAVADLDNDGWPEIVVGRYVLNHDLSQLTVLGDGYDYWPMMSAVGDVNLDGNLEVIAGNTVYSGTGGIQARNTAIVNYYGYHALGNFDADPYAEIVLVDGYGRVYLLDHQMNVIWGPVILPGGLSIGGVAGGPPTVADFDGDDQPEIGVAGTTHYVVLDTDGAILWQSPTEDYTSGVTGSSVFDFQGDGRAEVAYADHNYLRVYDGAAGTVLFEFPNPSGTLWELPVIADVDADDHAEIVVVANNWYIPGDFAGVRVLEAVDDSWVSTRQLWYQHAYDITSVDDNLRIVTNPTPVWLLYNTFRCQAPTAGQGNTYFIDIHHHLALEGTVAITDTIAPVPLSYTGDQIRWLYTQQDRQPVKTAQASQVLDPPLQPGEARRVSHGTTLTYTIRDNATVVTMPPLYVEAPRVVDVAPAETIVAPGDTAHYTVTLTNRFETEHTFDLSALGVPGAWVGLTPSVTLAAGATEELELVVGVPSDAEPQDDTLLVRALLPGGGEDAAGAGLSVREGPRLSLSPPLQAAAYRETATYTLRLTNTSARAEVYTFAVEGLEGLPVILLPDPVALDAGETASREMTVTAQAHEGVLPFAVRAEGDTGLSASAEGGLRVLAGPGVRVALSPQTAVTSRGVPAFYTLNVTNAGSVEDTYDLVVEVPAGWTYELTDGGVVASEVTLPAAVSNTASLQLVVIPAASAPPGDYPVTAVATSRVDATTRAAAAAALSILSYGVDVEVTPESTTLDPTGTHTWDVQVINTGAQADAFDLMAAGAISSEDGAAFSPSEVALEAGELAVVQLTAGPLPSALPGRDSFIVVARSQGDPGVLDHDTAEVTFEGVDGAEMALLPEAQTVEDTLEGTFVVVISNTGTVDDVYVLGGASSPALELAFVPIAVYVPHHAAASVVLTVAAPTGGDYTIIAQATSASSSAVYSDTSVLTVIAGNRPPEVEAGPGQTVDEGDEVAFNGSFTDPDAGDTHTIKWDFGDGGTAGGTLTPTHTYGDDGVYTVTLTVTDDDGGVGSDTPGVTVNNVAPAVSAWVVPTLGSPRQEVTFGGTFSDPGWLDTHTIDWDFGDGTTATGSLTASHAYELGGVYTATLTVTDDDGGVGRAVVVVGITCELYPIALHVDTLEGVAVGEEVEDIYNGTGPGNFGWLSWTGDPSVPALVESLTPPGNSDTYVNPYDSNDHTLSPGDWVYGKPGVSNSKAVRGALDELKEMDIIVPVWDQAEGKGKNVEYHVVGYAQVRITDYRLPGQNRISVIFLGCVECPE
jgi:uncharacterized repeat protein (TIGR01451 family)